MVKGRRKRLKVKNILFRTALLTVIAAGFYIGSTTSHAINVKYDSAESAYYTQSYHQITEDKPAGSPLEDSSVDGVDTSTGKLLLSRTDLSLEGMAGMDLELTRSYNSKKANIGKAISETTAELERDAVKITYTNSVGNTHTVVVLKEIYEKHKAALEDMFVDYDFKESWKDSVVRNTHRTKIVQDSDYNVYGIATGWSFDFPWIETMSIEGSGYASKPLYLHFGNKATMKIASQEDSVNKSYTITGFENYDYQDIRLEDFNKTVDGIPCRYLLRDKNGFRTYFNSDGVIVLQKDNHNNTIRFTYKNKIYFDTITDSVGRVVKFQYKESSHGLLLLNKVTTEGKKVSGGVSKETVIYNSSETSYQLIRGSKLYGAKLNDVTADGSKECYRYKTVESLVNTSGAGVASQRALTNQTYLIQGVEEDGCISKYEYRAGAIRAKAVDASQFREVVTQHYYVTREYEQDSKNEKKKANGIKYDYFQKQYNEEKQAYELVSYDDLTGEAHEMHVYGVEKTQPLTLVSSYNPKKKSKKKKVTDYVYKKSDLNSATLQLKKKPKKSTTVYIYNSNRLLTSQMEERKTKTETQYAYDKSGQGSLVAFETEKNYGTKRTGKAAISIQGYTYDSYRNVLKSQAPKAYRAKYKGKEALFTATYTYHGSGYPSTDTAYTLSEVKTIENYVDNTTKSKTETFLGANQVDVVKNCTYVSEKGNAYRLISQSESTYDTAGNETVCKYYPSCSSGDMGNVIQYTTTYNGLGQETKETVQKTSVRHPEQNISYVAEETTYDDFGNVLSSKDRKGLLSTSIYDENTGEEITSTEAKGTAYETSDNTYHTEDNLKTMSLDYYNRCTVNVMDTFSNPIIEKNEKAGTWTEYEYDYGEDNEDEEEDEEEAVVESQLVEERTYSFEPTEDKVLTKADGTKEYNYDIAGRGDKILSGTRHAYDDENEEIVTADFSGGAMDASHCSSWQLVKKETDTEEDHTITTSYTKQLNPKHYQKEVNQDNYYNQFDSYVLGETIQRSITDEDGNVVFEETTEIKGTDKRMTVTESAYDDFGKVTTRTTTIQKTENGKAKNKSESSSSYEYDYQGNVIKTETKSRKDETEPWEITVTKAVYNDNGQLIESYDAKGVKENYATQYEYDINGQQIKVKIPVEKKEGKVIYQTNTKEYDEDGMVIAEEIQKNDNEVQRTEYTYDILGQLIQVKAVESEKEAQYAQYVYDREGNKIRQFTGLTKPLILTLKEGEGDNSYTYMNHNYYVEISGKAKKDTYSETKYHYNKKNELTSYTDPEGNKESYVYDEQGNLVKTIDKNGNTITQEYDYQNRQIEQRAIDQEAEKETTHTYAYDDYGNVKNIDNRSFTYDVLTGQIETETIMGAANKDITKVYHYDSDGVVADFTVMVGEEKKLAYAYQYDGESKLTRVVLTDNGNEETIAQYEYDENGALIKQNGQKVSSSYQYDLGGRLTSLTNESDTGITLSAYHAAYQLNGQKIKEYEEVRGTNGQMEEKNHQYTYDRLGRLIKESHTGSDEISYTYDAHNNRKEMIQGKLKTAYKYNRNEELLRTDVLNTKTEKDTVTLYKYDKNGNQLATVHRRTIDKTKEGPQFDLNITLGSNQLNDNVVSHYNALNQPISALTKNYKVSYDYNDEGLRTEKTVNGKKRVYIWDGDNLIMELNEKGNVMKRYVRGMNLIYTDNGQGTDKTYYVQDTHGSVVQLVNEDGSIAKEYSYDAFGNEEKPGKKDDNPFRYCGEYYDKETETLYLRARNYSAEVGRFTTRDSYTGESDDIGSLNLYVYCDGDGVNQVDPSGHWGMDKKTGTYVHQDITREALNLVYNYSTSTELHLHGIKRKQLNALLDGVIYPDYMKEAEKGDKRFKTSSIKLFQSVKKELKIKKDGNAFHGKRKSSLENFKERAKKALKKEKNKQKKALMIGCVLHSIQDYYAHSAVFDLAEYRKNRDKYMIAVERKAKSDPYQIINAYHSDWGINAEKKVVIVNGKEKIKWYRNKGEHNKYKDNPRANFQYDFRTRTSKWIIEDSKEKNPRYKLARGETENYIKEKLKYIK